MDFKAKTLCAAFFAAATMVAGCGTTAVLPSSAPVASEPVMVFKNDVLNKTLNMIVDNSILNPRYEDLAKAAIDGVRKELGPVYAAYDDNYIISIIDNPTDMQRDKIIPAAVTAALESLSPHDVYMSRQDVEADFAGLKNIVGIGAHFLVDPDTGGLVIEEVAEIGPANRIDLRAGDIIIQVDDKVIKDDMAAGIQAIRGEAGSLVTLKILREGVQDPITVTTERSGFVFKPVLHKIIDDVAYIRLRDVRFGKTGELMKEAIEEMQWPGRTLKGLILDLRGNPGGLVTEAAEIADMLIDAPDGISLSVKGRKVSYVEKITPGDILDGLPVAVLVNDETASAAELLAGALQDYKRATVIGTQSYGKGSVQGREYLKQFDRTRGDAVKITTGLYFLPSGASLQGYGIMPDIVVDDVGSVRNEHENDLKNAIPNHTPELIKLRHSTARCTVDPALKKFDVSEDFHGLLGRLDKIKLCADDYLRKESRYSQIQPLPATPPAPRP